MTFIAPKNSFVFDEKLQNLLQIFGGKAKIVGGAVRDLILKIQVQDIDIATEYTPQHTIDLCNKSNIRTIPTGIKHGTITAIIDKKYYEITTLRADVETFSRAAKVEFGKDWVADAQRRDFTMNALYLNIDGTLFDPLSGYDDVIHKRVKFIGDIGARIQEDYLRILRYFRFCAQLNAPIHIETLYIIARHINGLRQLSCERVWSELQKILNCPYATTVLPAMAEIGIFQMLGIGVPYSISSQNTAQLNTLEKLFFHFIWHKEDASRISHQLRLSTQQKDALTLWAHNVWQLRTAPSIQHARKLLYYTDAENYEAILKLAALRWHWELTPTLLNLPTTYPIPKKPFSAAQFMAQGLNGKALGEALHCAELQWIDHDFKV